MQGLIPEMDPIGPNPSHEDCMAYCAAFEANAELSYPQQLAAMPAFEDVDSTTETIVGVDGNPITLYIDQPKNRSGTAPCVLHTHGGGMVLMGATDPGFVRWRKSLARRGLVAVGVEFRNGGGRLGSHPFPPGSMTASARWTGSTPSARRWTCPASLSPVNPAAVTCRSPRP